MAHTPGPWNLHPYHSDFTLKTVGEDGDNPWVYAEVRIASGEKVLCTVDLRTSKGGWPHVEKLSEMKANARLIAAAPELLEALEQACQYIEDDETAHGRKFGTGNAVRAAIAKARGVS